MKTDVTITINGEPRILTVEPSDVLLDVLRTKAGVKSPKIGCERGDCGSCTVLLDNKTVRSCLVLGIEADGHAVTTVEGLDDAALAGLEHALVAMNAFQCGFCAPGIVIAAAELLDNVRGRPGRRCSTPSRATCAAAPGTSRSSTPCSPPQTRGAQRHDRRPRLRSPGRPHPRGRRHPGNAHRRSRQGHGCGRVRRRHRLRRRPAARWHRREPPSARPHRVDRHQRRRGAARGREGRHRRGLPVHVRSLHEGSLRLRPGPCALRRRAGGGGRRPRPQGRQARGPSGRGRLRGAACDLRPAEGGRGLCRPHPSRTGRLPARAVVLPTRRHQHRPLAKDAQGRRRRRVRRRRRDPRGHLPGAPLRPLRHRAPRRGGAVRPGGAADGVVGLAVAVHPAPRLRRGAGAARPIPQGRPGGHPVRRRRVRRQGRGIDGDHRRRPGHRGAGPPGEGALDPRAGVLQHLPAPGCRGRDQGGGHEGRHDHRHRAHAVLGRRRLRRVRRQRGERRRSVGHRPLPDPQRQDRLAVRLHQPAAGRALPRVRVLRVPLRARVAHRPGWPRASGWTRWSSAARTPSPKATRSPTATDEPVRSSGSDRRTAAAIDWGERGDLRRSPAARSARGSPLLEGPGDAAQRLVGVVPEVQRGRQHQHHRVRAWSSARATSPSWPRWPRRS